ncbi:hypothetical protein JCM10213_008262 [Rhodosporidiobolus nylandii]
MAEEADAALAEDPQDGAGGWEWCNVEVSICFSPSFLVPVLWFSAVSRSGAPLTLSQLPSCTFFRPASSALFSPPSSTGDERLPFISQADHPATGRPCWFLHPCETEAIVAEVLSSTAEEENEGQEGEYGVRWLRAWLMVVSSVVDLCE